MTPKDLRNATWREVLTHLTEDMVRVHLAYQAHGPGTTRQVAQRAGISLLTLRPRTTDLHKLGLLELVGARQPGRATEGVYSYVERAQAEAAGAWRTRADFRRSGAARPRAGDEIEAGPAQLNGFPTVAAALASLTDPEKAALGASLMSTYGHHLKRRQPGTGQLELLTA